MEEQFISKKELLKLTGISYGQLYRWKRMEIIPENWFIKKSSFTGQETFFPKDKILERVTKIIELKDQYSLEELAKFFSPNPADIELSEEAVLSYKLLTEKTIRTYKEIYFSETTFSFESIFFLNVCQEVEKTKIMSLDSCLQTLTFIQEQYKNHGDISLELLAIQKEDKLTWLMVPLQTPIVLEHQAKIMKSFNLLELMNQVKMKLSGLHS